VRKALALILALTLCGPVSAQTSAMSTVSVVLSVIRIALNLGSGRQDYVQVDVQSSGVTLDQAKYRGFRTAVEQAVGTVVASQSQSQSQRLTQDEIITYSSGFVDRFEILEQNYVSDGIRIKMRVWVAESRLAHRLLGRSIDNQAVPGDQLSAQISTLIQERQTGDQLIAAVMKDFPDRSFVIEAKKSQAKFNEYRQAVLEVSVTLGWDQNWANSLFEALNRTKDPAKHWWVYNEVNRVTPVVKIVLADAHGTELIKKCEGWVLTRSQINYNYPKILMLDIQRDQLLLDNKHKLQGIIKINLGQDTTLMQQITQIKVSVVPGNQC
jgi:hypothetical protein